MEKHIKKNDRFKCKRTIKSGGKEMYTKGKIYTCDKDSENPENVQNNKDSKYLCGYITDNQKDKYHAWPYFPETHPICHDKWSDYFEKLDK